ncbi:MAG TPA: hypothetical protein VLZ10_07415 [Thermodesulfobacteriota bacterium]|nr:hypothetical protein [Thermodesulfobacteriota bacterium]
MKRKYSPNRGLGFSKIRSSLLLLGMLILWFVLLGFSPLFTEVTDAGQSVSSFKEEVKSAIKTLSVSLTDPVSKNNIGDIQTTVDKIISNAEKEEKPIRFGIGILDRNGVVIAVGFVRGTLMNDDFSRYRSVQKAFKQKKIFQERLYFQDRSELWIVCAPLVQGKAVVGAVVLGFNPTELKKDYSLSAEQFLALDFNK